MYNWIKENLELIGKVVGFAGGFWVFVKWSFRNIYKPLKAKYKVWDNALMELQNNGGSSMKDRIDSMSKDIKVMKITQEADIQLNSDARFQCSPDGNCIMVNDSLCRLFGGSKEELLGIGWLNFIEPEEREDVIEAWREALKSNLEMAYDYNIKHGSSGEKIWVHYKSYIKRNANREIISIFGIVHKKS